MDAALAAALEDVENCDEPALTVFVHALHALEPEQSSFLQALGVRANAGERRVFTGTVSARAAMELSDQPWIQQIRLSSRLRLLNP